MIKTCIFDLDGVIVDTAKYHYQAWKQLAKELGFAFTEEDNEALKGVSRMASLDILLSVGGMKDKFSESAKEAMATRKNGWYVDCITKMNAGEILPGVENFLKELKAAGIKIALGSASKNAGIILDRVGIRNLFDAVVDGNMVSHAKPDPQVFLLGAELTQTQPQECVVFEDAEAGIEAAHRGGMKCVGVGDSPKLAAADLRISGFEGFSLEKLTEIK